MLSKLPFAIALGCLLVIGSLIALMSQDEAPTQLQSAAEFEGVTVSPPPPPPPAPRSDVENYTSFLAKRDAGDFVHLYNCALRMGIPELEGIEEPELAFKTLSRGVNLGNLEFQFRDLSPADSAAALTYIKHDGKKFYSDAEYSDEELLVWKRVSSCKDGNCKDCLDPRSRDAIKKALASPKDSILRKMVARQLSAHQESDE